MAAVCAPASPKRESFGAASTYGGASLGPGEPSAWRVETQRRARERRVRERPVRDDERPVDRPFQNSASHQCIGALAPVAARRDRRARRRMPAGTDAVDPVPHAALARDRHAGRVFGSSAAGRRRSRPRRRRSRRRRRRRRAPPPAGGPRPSPRQIRPSTTPQSATKTPAGSPPDSSWITPFRTDSGESTHEAGDRAGSRRETPLRRRTPSRRRSRPAAAVSRRQQRRSPAAAAERGRRGTGRGSRPGRRSGRRTRPSRARAAAGRAPSARRTHAAGRAPTRMPSTPSRRRAANGHDAEADGQHVEVDRGRLPDARRQQRALGRGHTVVARADGRPGRGPPAARPPGPRRPRRRPPSRRCCRSAGRGPTAIRAASGRTATRKRNCGRVKYASASAPTASTSERGDGSAMHDVAGEHRPEEDRVGRRLRHHERGIHGPRHRDASRATASAAGGRREPACRGDRRESPRSRTARR